MVYDNGGNTIGLMDKQSREIEYSKDPETFPIDFSNEFVFDLSEKSKSMELSNVKIILLNSYYKIRGVILKEKFKIYMDKLGYHTSYEPVIYHALKTMYYFGEYAKNGICFCYKNKSIDIKHTCSCIKNTCIISSNGSVLLYGFKSYEQRDIVYEWLNAHLKASSCV